MHTMKTCRWPLGFFLLVLVVHVEISIARSQFKSWEFRNNVFELDHSKQNFYFENSEKQVYVLDLKSLFFIFFFLIKLNIDKR